MKILTSIGSFEFHETNFKDSISNGSITLGQYEFIMELIRNSFEIPLQPYYTEIVRKTGSLSPPLAVTTTNEINTINKTNVEVAKIAEKKAVTEEIDPVLLEEERIRIESKPLPEEVNRQLIDETVKVQLVEALKKAADLQVENPNSVYIIGTKEELIKMENLAKDAGITQPLNGGLIDESGKAIEKYFTLNAEPVITEATEATEKPFDFFVWLYDVFYK